MSEVGQRRFNTTGSSFPNKHDMLEALGRLSDAAKRHGTEFAG